MILGGLPLLGVALTQSDGGWTGVVQQMSSLTPDLWASVLYMSVLGGAAGYGIFFYNASKGNLTALSSLTFLTPMFAAAGGYLAFGEEWSPTQVAGALVTLMAVYLITTRPKNNKQSKNPKSTQGV